MKENLEDYKKIDFSKEYMYKNKKIYITHETKDYILCSFSDDKKSIFKLNKTEFSFK